MVLLSAGSHCGFLWPCPEQVIGQNPAIRRPAFEGSGTAFVPVISAGDAGWLDGLHAEIGVELVHVGVELVVGDHVHHMAL
ncbi:hypothetical protein, partial [Azospirillum sp. TSO5]|uniref:hypothetical protein n=1 Tax=Azospirillum sp. TSO5 TaxID=716760 RepID=UPI001B3BB4B5